MVGFAIARAVGHSTGLASTFLLVLAFASVARAEASESTISPISKLPLSPLPKPPSLEIPPPKPNDLTALDEHLKRLTDANSSARTSALHQILEVEASAIPAIHRRIALLAEKANRDGMKRLLLDIRDDARDLERKAMRARGEKGPVKTPDYLEMALSHAKPESTNWQELVRLLGLSRMLVQIGTVDAARELVYIYVRFDFMRIDTQLQLEKMGDRSIAALIETQRHKAEKIGHWASRRLDLRGKAIPSEAVQIEDHAILADILRAYGRIRDPDAARIIVSFANSERVQVREAAREAVAMLGDVGQWQLRDTYENIVGKKPPREWSWERTARELFTEFDRLRLSRVYHWFEQGKTAEAKGNLDEMASRYDRVLAQDPLFDQRSQMVDGYVAYARNHLDDARDKAEAALRRAERLSGDELAQKPIHSLVLTLQAEALAERGVFDQVLLRRAVDLDPRNTRAQSLLDQLQRGDLEKQSRFNRYVAAAAIGGVALLAIVLVVLRRRSTKQSDAPESTERPDAENPEAESSDTERSDTEKPETKRAGSADP
jgi:hypothetical protein